MNAQVTAALISGGAALIVAILGIAGAIAAQLFATRRAFHNALALQARQYAQQEQERQEHTRREDAYRYAEQRRSTYGRFVRLARDLATSTDEERTAAKNTERIAWRRYRRPSQEGLEAAEANAEQLAAAARERTMLLRSELDQARDEIHLLASPGVRQAADRLWDAAHKATHSADPGYTAAATEFLEAARRELGIRTDQEPHRYDRA